MFSLFLWIKTAAVRRWFATSMLAVSSASAQTAVDLRTQAKSVDFSNATFTKTSKSGATLPATCTTAETFFLTSAPAGRNLYGCNPTNTWTLLSGSSTGDNLQGNIIAPGLATSTGQYYAWDPVLGQFRLFSLGALFSVAGTTTNIATESVVQYGTAADVPSNCVAYGRLFFESDGADGDKLLYCNGATFERVGGAMSAGPLSGPYLPFGAAGSSSNFVSSTANRVYLYQFLLPAPIQVGKFAFYVATAAAGSQASFAIYDAARNKVFEGAAADLTTVGAKTSAVPPAVLQPGVYYVAFATNSTTAAVAFISTPSIMVAVYNNSAQRIGFCSQTANFGLAAGSQFPSACTLTSLASNTSLPLVLMEP